MGYRRETGRDYMRLCTALLVVVYFCNGQNFELTGKHHLPKSPSPALSPPNLNPHPSLLADGRKEEPLKPRQVARWQSSVVTFEVFTTQCSASSKTTDWSLLPTRLPYRYSHHQKLQLQLSKKLWWLQLSKPSQAFPGQTKPNQAIHRSPGSQVPISGPKNCEKRGLRA